MPATSPHRRAQAEPIVACDCCGEPHPLSDLNAGMLCIECAEPEPREDEENEDDFIDLSDAAMRREHGFYV